MPILRGYGLRLVYAVEIVRITTPIVPPVPPEKQENMMTQKTEIEIEMSETVAYSRRGERFESFCPTCKIYSPKWRRRS